VILVALGANLPAPDGTTALETVKAAVARVDAGPNRVVACSGWYSSPAWPPSDQPDYVNGVVRLETQFNPLELLYLLHQIEASSGRRRTVKNAARILDIDLIDYHGEVSGGVAEGGDNHPILPHPRAHQRAFVLLPLMEIAPEWHHPVSGRSVNDLIRNLPPDHLCEPIAA
jgi:2-amino-4-hydroxy-6-hydroxymethyldihydropteridine diphosphokinase